MSGFAEPRVVGSKSVGTSQICFPLILCLLFKIFFVYLNIKLMKEEERIWQERNP